MRVLVAEDDPLSLEALQTFLESQGHEVIPTRDGREAVKALDHGHPDLVLLDVGMPHMDGLAVTQEIRRRSGPRWVPILFLSARVQVQDILKGLEAGADDYLTKPVNYVILQAKIRALERIAALQAELARHFDRVEDEHLLAQSLLERLSRSPGRKDPALKWVVMPLHRFSGDQIAAWRSEEGVFTLLLADAMGHGLPAAISLLPILRTFSRHAPSGTGLARISREMNEELRSLMPSSRFVALLLLRVDPRDRSLEVWNGGIPFCALMGRDGTCLRTFESRNPPVGILPDSAFEPEPERMHWPEDQPCTVVACSDGLLDGLSPGGRPFSEQGVLREWQGGPWQTGFERVLAGTFAHLAGEPLTDDVSLLALRCE